MSKEQAILELIKPIIIYVNLILTKLVPQGELYLVLLFAAILAYYVKNKHNWGKIAFIFTTIIIYGSLRFFGFGG